MLSARCLKLLRMCSEPLAAHVDLKITVRIVGRNFKRSILVDHLKDFANALLVFSNISLAITLDKQTSVSVRAWDAKNGRVFIR